MFPQVAKQEISLKLFLTNSENLLFYQIKKLVSFALKMISININIINIDFINKIILYIYI